MANDASNEFFMFEVLVQGAFVIAAGLFVLFLALIAAPFVFGYLLSYHVIFRGEREAQERQQRLESERRYREQQRLEEEREEAERRQKEESLKQLRAWQKLPFGKSFEDVEKETREKEKRLPPLEGFQKDFYKESKLTRQEKEGLYSAGFKRLKISPDGRSGAAYYWVHKRYNESKEHAFFCYLIAAELKKKRIRNVRLNVSDGPDIVFTFKRKKYCFEVETGSNLVRDAVYVFKKFAFNKQDFHKCFVFVTKKKFKYRYSKMADLVTRATLKKTIADLGSENASERPADSLSEV